MASNETSAQLWPCLHTIDIVPWRLSCILCRLGGVIILTISIICFTFNTRFLYFQRCQNTLVISLFIASLLVITISVPSVLSQLFTCHRHCSEIYCRIEGFISYLSGCLCMLIFMVLSIHRYLLLCSYHRLILHEFSTFICWILSISFTLPLVFNYLNSYLPEGLGFHCSINWHDQSTISRLYIFFSFTLMYFLPLIIIFIVNFRSHFIIRNIYSKSSLFIQYSYQASTIKICRETSYFDHIYDNQYYIRKAMDRKRFRMDYRFLRAIIFLVSSYIIAWTPYSIIAILQLLNIKFIIRHAFLITLTAFIAKLSVILAPFVYLSTMNYRFFKRIILFQ